MKNVLFLCVHNSARSQMAEAYLKKFGRDEFLVESAGLEPGKLNPIVVQVMKEDGIDISGNETKDVFDLCKTGKRFYYLITVCDLKNAGKCPIFPGTIKKFAWDIEDPSSLKGTDEQILTATRIIRDKIKEKVMEFVKEEISE